MFSFKDKGKDWFPVAKTSDKKILYCTNKLEDDVFDDSGSENSDEELKTLINKYKNAKAPKDSKETDLVKLKNKTKFKPIPDIREDREILYIYGASGSGKSYFCKEYIEEYKKMFPDNDCFLFSMKHEDSKLDKLCIRIDNDDLMEDMPGYEVFENSLVIFDDCDSKMNKKLYTIMQNLKNQILEFGRSSNIFCLITSHIGAKGAESRTVLNETHGLVLFFRGSPQNSYLLERYYGLSKKETDKYIGKNRDKLFKGSRWILFKRLAPNFILTEKMAYRLE